ncbi:mannose-6-phosphate isomerase, class I [Borrelia miyamotoi]|nr:Mannose-6-phosphate isomerase [Borrelia miyamotoi FR64b]BCR08806.1 mannose-6-phosphate isomerase, class I [Borrelia miyamotoi]BCR09636.1 mannose-6-phosphate isomerase, class I [Borrelia miyamotoi]BCR10465.1 mannose-6-phosphate isomerase, class I [Borrelia miyamotoi]BCR11295.1 mannose-6-phosphate isomerase, class I [Borrelia miyamotoi]
MILLVMNGEIYINDDFFLQKGESLFVGDYNEGLLIHGNGEIFVAISL